MKLRKFEIYNVRSFLDRQELVVEGDLCIVIGPNGGGKTNLFDAINLMLRKHLFKSGTFESKPTQEQPFRRLYRENDQLKNLEMERHFEGLNQAQGMSAAIELTDLDAFNIKKVFKEIGNLRDAIKDRYENLPLDIIEHWDLSEIRAGQQFVFSVENNGLLPQDTIAGKVVAEYCQYAETLSRLRDEFDLGRLTTPVLYLPVNRSASGFQSSVALSGFDEFTQKKNVDITSSRTGGGLIALAIGRLAQKYRLLLGEDKGGAYQKFLLDPNIISLTEILDGLGYQWKLVCKNELKNEYDIQLTKQGSSFLVSAASSGEREILTYLFAIFGLNVVDALVVIDEPELHLHPTWQTLLLKLFTDLAERTGNQFFLATHTPTFVSPESIHFVSRVHSVHQVSKIQQLTSKALPDIRHLMNIVNSQNNERIFFADHVVLVEGLSDQIFFEAVLDVQGRMDISHMVVEVVGVGGKGLFPAYQKLLTAFNIPNSIIADLDFVEQVGTGEVRALFKTDDRNIGSDVIKNPKSRDGASLVSAIDNAIRSGHWKDAEDVWQYIKSRRTVLRSDLSGEDRKTLDDFINDKRLDGIYVLKIGTLESYLPEGYRSKDIGRLVELVRRDGFWNDIGGLEQSELSDISESILSPYISK